MQSKFLVPMLLVIGAALVGGTAEAGSKPAPKSKSPPAKHAATPAKHAAAPAKHAAAPAKHAAAPAKHAAAHGVAKKPATKGHKGSSPTLHGKLVGVADPAVRRQVAGGPTVDDVELGAESPELRALREAERELFPPAGPRPGKSWPSELPSPVPQSDDAPIVHATGVAPPPPPSSPPAAEGGKDLSWLSALVLPDLPVRWDARVVRYLELYKNDPRGRGALAVWLKRSGKYLDEIRRTLASKGLPRDLAWLAMIESGFEPTIRSPAGAVGLWQFMPLTGRSYGLPVDRWVDERMNVRASTEAAADFLSDLHRRFGSWELAMASYNMGYAGVAAAVRKYNTNDFWELSRLEGSMPWETTLYVPKIIAAAIVMHNLKVFGLDGVTPEAPVEYEEVTVPYGVPLKSVARVAGCNTKDLEALNPELRAARTPPRQSDAAATAGPDQGFVLRVPPGKAELVSQSLPKLQRDDTSLERYVVRFGETLDQIAAARATTVAKLVDINAIAQGEVVRGGTVLLVPHAPTKKPAGAPAAVADEDKPVVIVPSDLFVYPDRKRVFYKVLVGDTVRDVAVALHVSVDELRRWNDIDPSARLQEGMTLQAFVPDDADLSRVVLLSENDVRAIPVGSDDFFTYWESKGRQRVTVKAKAGETIADIGRRYGQSAGQMERINRRSRHEVLDEGDEVILYLKPRATPAGAQAKAGNPLPDPDAVEGSPLPPLETAPRPDLLPP